MLRRPMMYITSAFAAAIITSYYYGAYFTLLIICIAAYFLLFSTGFAKVRTAAMLIVISMVSGTLCFVFDNNDAGNFEHKNNEHVEAFFMITQLEKGKTTEMDGTASEYLKIVAKTDLAGSKDVNKREKVLIDYYEEDGREKLAPGMCIKVKGTLNEPSGRKNPGCFDYSVYLRSLGIRYTITDDTIELCGKCEHYSFTEDLMRLVYTKSYFIKESFLERLGEHAGIDTASLVRAIMFGDDSLVDEDVLEGFRKNGTAHVMAVSGLHIGIIYGFICAIWRWKKGKVFFAAVIVFFAIYMFLASFSPSVVRAVIMVWLHVFASLTNRRYDMASAAFFTALIMMIHEPMCVFNVGFQMSYLAVLTLSLMVPLIKRFYSGVFLMSLAVQLGLTPYMIYVFNYFSVAAVLVNVPVIFLIGIIVPAGMCCMGMMVIFEPLGMFISKILGGLCMILVKVNDATCIEGITVFDAVSPDVWWVAAYYLILLVFVAEDGRIMIKRKNKKAVKTMAVVVTFTVLIFSLAAGNSFKKSDVVFVDVGQGDCIHIRVEKNISGSKYDYLFDGGGSVRYDVGKKTLKPYLLKNGTKTIDGAFVTHLHTDHYKGIAELCREGMIEHLYVFEGYIVREDEILAETGLDKEQITYLHAGQTVELGENAYAEILWPEASNIREYERISNYETDENSMSLIMKVTVDNKTVMVTGDVDTKCLDALSVRYGDDLDSDILKVAHHGSRYSDSPTFTEAVDPEYAVFQVGKNNFGHPDEGVVEKFRQKGIMIYRNDLDGAVGFDFGNNGEIRVKTVKGE